MAFFFLYNFFTAKVQSKSQAGENSWEGRNHHCAKGIKGILWYTLNCLMYSQNQGQGYENVHFMDNIGFKHWAVGYSLWIAHCPHDFNFL